MPNLRPLILLNAIAAITFGTASGFAQSEDKPDEDDIESVYVYQPKEL